jgi:hypothetical protein
LSGAGAIDVFTGLGNVVQVWHEFGLGASQNQLRLRNCPNVITLFKRVYSAPSPHSHVEYPHQEIVGAVVSVEFHCFTPVEALQRFARTLWPSPPQLMGIFCGKIERPSN